MLHRSFKPAKCKTALQMGNSRLKILKNKKEVQIKQLRKELAHLLESGQDQTAMIRVEHVVREEKTVAAYELIGIFCELLVARLAVIETQKACPTDLKEAVASVVFAARRLSDVPELADVLKHFTAKYGKEFVSAAVELRPNCGVSRLLVEKLSVKAPDGPTKFKILTAIAEEHNIKWEPKSFGEPDPKSPEDFLSGQNTFQTASKIHADPSKSQERESSNVQAPPVVNVLNRSNERHDVSANSYTYEGRSPSHSQNVAASNISGNKTMRPESDHYGRRSSGSGIEGMEYRHPYSGEENSSDVQAPPAVNVPQRSNERHDVSVNSNTYEGRSPSHSQNVAASGISGNKTMPSDTYQYDRRSSGSGIEGMEYRHPYSGEENSMPTRRQNWNMKFKDATDAARAAAESAERASMAARAAAELSTKERLTRQNSTESQNVSSSYNFQNEPPQRYGQSSFPLERISRRRYEDTGINQNDKHSWIETSKSRKDETWQDHLKTADTYSRPNSSEMAKNDPFGKVGIKKESSESDHTSDDHLKTADRYSRRNSSELVKNDSFGKLGVKKESSESDTNLGYSEEVQVRKQSSQASSRSHSSVGSDFNSYKSLRDMEENVFASNDEEQLENSPKGKDSHAYNADFDDYGSFFNKPKFDIEDEQNQHGYGLGFSLLGQESPAHRFSDINSLSFKENQDKSQGKHSPESHIPQEKYSSPVFDDVPTSSTIPYSSPVFDDVPTSSTIPYSSPVFDDVPTSSTIPYSSPVFDDVPTSSTIPLQAGHSSSSKYDDYGLESESEDKRGKDEIAVSKGKDETAVGKHLESFSKPVTEKVKTQAHQSSRSVVQEVEDDNFPLDSDELMGSGTLEESGLETQTELNFGVLTGGLRNKGRRLPLHRKSPASNAITSSEQDEDTQAKVKQSFSSSVVNSSVSSTSKEPDNENVIGGANKKSSSHPPDPSSSDDDSEEELPKRASSKSHEPYKRQTDIEGEECNKKSNFKIPVSSYLHSSASDDEEEVPRNSSNVSTQPNIGLSRRTKGQPRNPEKRSFSKTPVTSEHPVTAKKVSERDSNEEKSRSLASKIPVTSEHPVTAKKPSERDSNGEKLKLSAKEQPSSSLPKIATSVSTESAKTSSSVETPSKEKATHVHPKLPDYDDIFAKFGPLRSNR